MEYCEQHGFLQAKQDWLKRILIALYYPQISTMIPNREMNLRNLILLLVPLVQTIKLLQKLLCAGRLLGRIALIDFTIIAQGEAVILLCDIVEE